MALWSVDPPALGSIKIRVIPPVDSAGVSATTVFGTKKIQLTTDVTKGIPTWLLPWQPVDQITDTFTVQTQSTKLSTVGGSFATNPVEFDHFLSYEYNQHFLTPPDSWRFDLAGDELTESDNNALVPGARVEVSIDGAVQSVGFIDSIETRGNRGSGTIVCVHGRDWLSCAIDAHVDPLTKFDKTMSLADVINAVFSAFGVTVQVDDDIANKNAITGRVYGTRTSKKGRTSQKILAHLIRPYLQEGAFQFVSRVSQRFGLWIWPTITFGTVVVGTPDFTERPRYQLVHRLKDESNNNVLDYTVTNSRRDQPTIIFASGWGGGGEFPKSSLRGAIVNPLVATPAGSIAAIRNAYPGLRILMPQLPQVSADDASLPIVDPNARPVYLYDPESHNQDELNAFLRREMSLRMRNQLTARYSFAGHRINGQPVAVNTMIDVDDDRAGIHMPMWIVGRQFVKDHGGTKTTLELLRPGTLQF